LTIGRRHDVTRQRDRHLERYLRAVAAVKRRTTRDVVSDPERTAGGRERDTPRILQDRVDHPASARGEIGDEFGDDIGISLPLGIIIISADGRNTGDG